MPILWCGDTTATFIALVLSPLFLWTWCFPISVLTFCSIFLYFPLELGGCYLHFSQMREGEGRGRRPAHALLCTALQLHQLLTSKQVAAKEQKREGGHAEEGNPASQEIWVEKGSRYLWYHLVNISLSDRCKNSIPKSNFFFLKNFSF